MKTILIGGDFGNIPKSSSVINKLSKFFDDVDIKNGGTLDDLKINLDGFSLVIWSPNIDNEIDKQYPKKEKGSVLICTKVLRENRNYGDAVARIFKMNANAVITIESSSKPFKFQLIDALGNLWCDTSDLSVLSKSIKDFFSWSKGAIRIDSIKTDFNITKPNQTLISFCDIIKNVADKVENERGGRYFGNASTRCSKMFPSLRTEDDFLVSGRNIPKDRISIDDFVFVKLGDEVDTVGKVIYSGNRKPSVDTPIQLVLYRKYLNINFMIHGHAYIDGVDFTKHYFPCGDLRECEELLNKFPSDNKSFILNLKNHGFIIATDTIEKIKEIVNNSKFIYRNIGKESI